MKSTSVTKCFTAASTMLHHVTCFWQNWQMPQSHECKHLFRTSSRSMSVETKIIVFLLYFIEYQREKKQENKKCRQICRKMQKKILRKNVGWHLRRTFTLCRRVHIPTSTVALNLAVICSDQCSTTPGNLMALIRWLQCRQCGHADASCRSLSNEDATLTFPKQCLLPFHNLATELFHSDPNWRQTYFLVINPALRHSTYVSCNSSVPVEARGCLNCYH